MPTICLCAIFRNEQRNVRRCLDALLDVVDYVSICDTGSTDDTPGEVEAWGREHGVPAIVHRMPFRDFGYNRSQSFELARHAFPDADYMLFVDADMVLRIEPRWNKAALTANHYLIRQRNPVLDYWNTRLVRADLPWRCVGVTHEYWECAQPAERVHLDTLWIDDLGDGGCKHDKFDRDRRLLEAAIEDAATSAPLRTRYLFYLAQTLRDAGDRAGAYTCYGRRVAAGGWEEEVYVAQCEQASLAILLDEPHEDIVAGFMRAWALRPTRAEALWLLARYCRERKRYAEGYLYAKTGIDIPPPAGDILFIRREAYEWSLLDEFALCAYWIGHFAEAVAAGERLLSEARHPPTERARLEANLAFAREALISGNPP